MRKSTLEPRKFVQFIVQKRAIARMQAHRPLNVEGWLSGDCRKSNIAGNVPAAFLPTTITFLSSRCSSSSSGLDDRATLARAGE